RAGWRPRVCAEATFRHRVGSSSAGSNRLPLVLRGRATTYRKNLRPPLGALAAELLVTGTGLRALLAGARGAGSRPRMSGEHWRDAWRRRGEWRRGWSGPPTVLDHPSGRADRSTDPAAAGVDEE